MLPTMRGIIARRLLVNFRVHPEAIARFVPSPLRPLLVDGWAIAGVCLIRLERVRPSGLPAFLGFAAENAAHRVAVTWQDGMNARTAVWIIRRDSDSPMVRWAGGRLFPGVHGRAEFEVSDGGADIDLSVSGDRGMVVDVRGRECDALPEGSVFGDLDTASTFFAGGALGFSPGRSPGCCDALELACDRWRMRALRVERVVSSFYQGLDAEFDSVLVMRDIHHRWLSRPSLQVAPGAVATF